MHDDLLFLWPAMLNVSFKSHCVLCRLPRVLIRGAANKSEMSWKSHGATAADRAGLCV